MSVFRVVKKKKARGEAAFEEARAWCHARLAFGKPLFAQQAVAHKLAEMKTSLCASRAFVDSCLELHSRRRLDGATASMAKLSATELCWKVTSMMTILLKLILFF